MAGVRDHTIRRVETKDFEIHSVQSKDHVTQMVAGKDFERLLDHQLELETRMDSKMAFGRPKER